jgi:hypothetical protein
MLKYHFVQALFGCLLLCACIGCTVREDRLPCPCYLDIDYRELLATEPSVGISARVDLLLQDADSRWMTQHSLDLCPEMEEISVEKSHLQVISLVHDKPWRDFLAEGTRVTYEPGNEMDALYASTQWVDCSDEEACCVLHPHKQFSTLQFTDEADGALCRRYNMVIRGSTCGFDAADLSAVEGEYLYTVQEDDGQGRICVRIPRQLRNDLLLEFWEKDRHNLLFSCPVGLYLFAAGYDPAAADLPDYSLRIDFRDALLYLRIADWKDEYIYSLYD